MAKYNLTDGVVSLTSRDFTADRTVCKDTVTYEPHANSGKNLDVNALVYELMIIAAYDMLEAGAATFSGEYTAAEMAGTVGYLNQFTHNGNPEWEDYDSIRIKTKTFSCSFNAGGVFKQMAEWEGVAGIKAGKAYKFVCDGKEMPKSAVMKPYKRCHGYHPRTISLAADEKRINEKFEVLGRLYQSLTSEGMRKAMSVCAAARLFDNKSYEVKAMVKTAMRWKLWRDYAKKPGATMLPIQFGATDFQCGPECYKQVDTGYVQELVDHWNKLVADSPMPEWPKQGDWVQFKNRENMQKKYHGKYLCEGMTASLSTYGDRIEWRASVRVKKFDNEYFLPGQLEPVEEKTKKGSGQTRTKTDKKPAAVKVKGTDYTVKSDGRTETFGSYIPKALTETQTSDIKPQASTVTLAEQLRQALLARLAA